MTETTTTTPDPAAPASAWPSPDDRLEAAYWRFDTLRGGQLRQSDRDAFKGALRAYLAGKLDGDVQVPRPDDESAGAMLTRLGVDGFLWAREFWDMWGGRLGEVDQALMIAWFCNVAQLGIDEGARRERKSLAEIALATHEGDGEPPNTVTRMAATIEAAAVECGPAMAQRLRAAFLEFVELLRLTQAGEGALQTERNAWIDRAAGLYQVIDRIDDHAEFLDPSAPAAAITRQIDRSRAIVYTDGGGREVWGQPPKERTVDGAPIWWPDPEAEVAGSESRLLRGRPTAVQHSLGAQDGELASEAARRRVVYNEDGTATVLVGEAATPRVARVGDWIVRDWRGHLFVLVDGFAGQRFDVRAEFPIGGKGKPEGDVDETDDRRFGG